MRRSRKRPTRVERSTRGRQAHKLLQWPRNRASSTMREVLRSCLTQSQSWSRQCAGTGEGRFPSDDIPCASVRQRATKSRTPARRLRALVPPQSFCTGWATWDQAGDAPNSVHLVELLFRFLHRMGCGKCDRYVEMQWTRKKFRSKSLPNCLVFKSPIPFLPPHGNQ